MGLSIEGCFMRLNAFLLMALLALPAFAEEAPIQRTIQGQIDAFLKDDFATAFTYASPNIKSLFGTPENFGNMVRQGYPMVHRPAEVKMLDLHEENGRLWQRVLITDQNGQNHVLDYQMVETANGWQINGVRILPSPGVGA
jgi:hypothetical protein